VSTSDGLCTENLIEKIAQIRGQISEMDGVAGLCHDPLPVLNEVEQLTREGMERINDVGMVIDNDQRILSLSESTGRNLRTSATAVVGRRLFEAFPGLRTPFFEDRLCRALASGYPTDFVARFAAPLAGWHEVRAVPTGSGAELYFQAVLRDGAPGCGVRPRLHEAALSALRACRRTVGGTRGRVVLFSKTSTGVEVITADPAHLQQPFDALFSAEHRSAWSRAAVTRNAALAAVGLRVDGEAPRNNLLCVPLIIDDAIVGLLELDAGPGCFSEEDARVAASIAECCALSVKGGGRDGRPAVKTGEVARTLFDSNDAPVYMSTFAGRIIDANRAAGERLGYTREELLTLDSRGLYSRACGHRLTAHLAALRRTGHSVCEAEHVHRDGALLPVELDSLLVAYDGEPAILTVARDLRRQKSVEALRAQSRKMDAAGDMAKGMANDFGDIAASILGRIDLLLVEPTLSSEVTQHLREMKREAQRATDLTLRLLAFNGRRSSGAKILDLNTLVGGMEQRIQRLVDERAVLATHLDPAVGTVLADPSLLEQAIIELALIAREALAGNGEITLMTRAVRAGEAPLRLHPEADCVDHAALILHETGPGIAGAPLQQLHEPFFTSTTRERGKAMGLATVHGIIRQLGGFIEADGSPSNGMSFRVFLPSFTPLSPRGGAVLPESALRAASAGVILLVEADPTARKREEEVLRQCGFPVACAPSVEEAFAVLGDGRFVMTAVAPAAREGEMARELARRFPEAGLLLVSDERDVRRETRLLTSPGRAVLCAPFSLRELAFMVWELAGHGRG
jgi:PAS domain S-box-containing protein